MTIIYPRTTNQYHSFTMYRRRIENIEDEQRLLEEMLTLQSQIREQRERKRKTTTRDSERYTKMLAPVTKTLQVLAQPKPPTSAAVLIDLSDYGGADYAVVSDTSKPPDIIPPKEEISLDVPGQLFLQASSKVPMRNRDDGLLGLE